MCRFTLLIILVVFVVSSVASNVTDDSCPTDCLAKYIKSHSFHAALNELDTDAESFGPLAMKLAVLGCSAVLLFFAHIFVNTIVFCSAFVGVFWVVYACLDRNIGGGVNFLELSHNVGCVVVSVLPLLSGLRAGYVFMQEESGWILRVGCGALGGAMVFPLLWPMVCVLLPSFLRPEDGLAYLCTVLLCGTLSWWLLGHMEGCCAVGATPLWFIISSSVIGAVGATRSLALLGPELGFPELDGILNPEVALQHWTSPYVIGLAVLPIVLTTLGICFQLCKSRADAHRKAVVAAQAGHYVAAPVMPAPQP